MKIITEVDARKNPIDREAAWSMLSGGERILIASGRKTKEFTPDTGNREEILKGALGRSGTLRAPTLRIGRTFYLGFNTAMYEALAGKG